MQMMITTAMIMIPLAPKEDPLDAGGAACASVVVIVWDEAVVVCEWVAGIAVEECVKTTLWTELRNTSGVLVVMEGVRNEWDVGSLCGLMGSREAVVLVDMSVFFLESREAEQRWLR